MRLALLANYIAPYRLSLYEEMNARIADFSILLSTPMEAGRLWAPAWSDLPVKIQRNVSFRGTWKHPHQFSEPLTIQFPYDTIPHLLRVRPDIIVSYEMGMRTLQAALYRRVFRSSRLVIWATISDVTEQGRGRLRHWLRRKLLRWADAVLVSGQSGARYIERFGVGRERLFLVPFTTDLAPFLELPPNRPDPIRRRILFSGALAERKGILPFLKNLVGWARRNPNRCVEFYAVGGGPLRDQIAAFDVPGNLTIRLLGHVPYEKLPEIYGDCGILALPTLADDWGLVVTEAMASGVPVLGSIYSQAVEELVKHRENGWVFRPECAHEVQAALDDALHASTEKLNQISEQARVAVRDITPASVADRIVEILRVVQSREGRASAL